MGQLSEEQGRELDRWNATDTHYVPVCIHELIEQQVARTPDAVALRCGDQTLTYTQLNERANRLAHWLIASGVQRNELVALYVERSLDMVVGMLAVQKSGAAYVPMDTQYPPDRLAHILSDCGAKVLVTQTRLLPNLAQPPAHVICLDAADQADAELAKHPATNPAVGASLDDLAWALYTSGSTGKPKGALLHRRAISSFYQWFAGHFRIDAGTRTLVITSLGFDLTQRMCLLPLSRGGCVSLLASEVYDAGLIAATLEQDQIDVLSCTPSGLYGLLDDANEKTYRQLSTLRLVIPGGEVIQGRRLAAWMSHPSCKAEVHNSYGPTETHDLITTYKLQPADFEKDRVTTVGKPLANVKLYVLDEHLQLVEPGASGVLYVGGIHVGRGYIKLPEKNAETFLDNPFRPGEKMYKVGDQVHWLDNGNIEFEGRTDHQVKVRGWRIELPEIEDALVRHPAVREAVITAPSDPRGERFLAAYVQLRSGHKADVGGLRAHLTQTLPDYMLPTVWSFLDEFPKNANGKVDRANLPVALAQRPIVSSAYLAPQTLLQQRLAEIWRELLGFAEIGVDDRFFELGGTSLNATQFVGRVSHRIGLRIPITDFFAAPTLAGFAAVLERRYTAAVSGWLGIEINAPVTKTSERTARSRPVGTLPVEGGGDIAIVGLACRVPGANDVETFWDNLVNGRESLSDLSDADLEAAGVDAETRGRSDYVRRAGVLDEAYAFDAAFFGYTPREAELMDPAHRVLLECAHHALEHAGIAPGAGARIGAFAGTAFNSYAAHNLLSHEELRRQAPEFQMLIGGEKDFNTSRIAFKLDLHGPAITIQTACSTSGVALHLACQSLRVGDCDAAIVGGGRVSSPQHLGYVYLDGGPMSHDGRVRPFDAGASGMLLSSGVACLVLKRLSDAQTEGDHIYAVVKGSAINNDGSDKIGYTAPSVHGQTQVLQQALVNARVSADSVSYVETHGTGTQLGDPIEVAALAEAYAGAQNIFIGSVKSNLGHLDAGAAAIALVKTALALDRAQLPPTVNFRTPNPECGFEHTPFSVNAELRPWVTSGPRRAAVSAFGFGGTNFHGILEQPPAARAAAPATRAPQLLKLSAKSDDALKAAAQALAAPLSTLSANTLADAAWTLDTGRARYPRRGFAVVREGGAAGDALRKPLITGTPVGATPSLVFMFPGQGAQHVGMGRELYDSEPVFRSVVDECAQILLPALGLDLREVLYPKGDATAAAETLKATQLAQPAIFTISYATARLWESWGLVPEAMIGHSVGEFVAATLAGVFQLEHALLILAERARLMQSMPSGGMLAVRLSESEVHPYLAGAVGLAGLNAPQLVVLSGPHAELEAVNQALQAKGVGSIPLHTSHAFHSVMMDPIVAPFTAVVAKYPRAKPTRRFVSTFSGTWAGDEQVQDPAYWASQLRHTVRFAPALTTLLEARGRVLLEVGPGQNLTTSARQIIGGARDAAAIASLPHAGQAEVSSLDHLLEAAGRLYCAGIELDALRFHGAGRGKIGLPGYAFARTRYCMKPGAGSAQGAVEIAATVEPVVAAETPADRASQVRNHLAKVMTHLTGVEFPVGEDERTFLEHGLDSLMLTQVAGKLKSEFRVELKFRQLIEEYTSLATLAKYLEEHSSGTPGINPAAVKSMAAATAPETNISDGKTPPKAFGAGARISKAKGEALNERQRIALDALTSRYLAKTGKSKAFAQAHRAHLADPRTVSGFRPLIKELVYPIVTPRSLGAKLWDLDDNEYIDVTCGFGSMFFGHRADFVVKEVEHQLKHLGYEIGPQTPLAGECAKDICEFLKMPRAAFCATGSEAVLAAMRTARTVTGRNLIVMFNGDYHGVFDEVIFRGTPSLRTIPAAPGIPPESVANTLILDYGTEKTMEILRNRADEIAAIIVEPVQSRRPDWQPRDFLLQLRELCTASGSALVFDEIVTGFRCALGGAQEYFGIPADLGTYGKVIGGGLQIGVIAGIERFMDALDGGQWGYGDDSVPEVGVTYFAGTFVRHPLSLAACKAVCEHLKANPGLYAATNQRTTRMVDTLNLDLQKSGTPLHIAQFTSVWKPEYTSDQTHGDLLYMYLREAGIHIWDGRPCFLSAAHTDQDCERVIEGFRYAVSEMQKGGFFEGSYQQREIFFNAWQSPYRPPVPNAQVGRDADGNPAWFVPDPTRPGRYSQVELR